MTAMPEIGRTKQQQPTKKLIPNLSNKTNYVCHYPNLQFYVNHGLIITKIHRILAYEQGPWLKPWIDYCNVLSLGPINIQCPKCGRKPHHLIVCPAKNQNCHYCGKTRYFERVCRLVQQTTLSVKMLSRR